MDRSRVRWISAFPIVLWAFIGVLLTTIRMSASTDTLRHFDSHARFHFIADPGIEMQVERFDLATPSVLHAFTVILGGDNPHGHALLHLFGNEGGAPVPRWMQSLMAPIELHKTRAGIERIRVVLDQGVRVSPTQLFVGLSDFSPGTALISDRVAQQPSCVNAIDTFGNQSLLRSDGTWQRFAYSFAIEVEIDQDKIPSKFWFADVGSALHVFDSTIGNRSIAWADIDSDGFADVLAGGRLWRNVHGNSFEQVTLPVEEIGTPHLNFFIDIDADGDPDIVFIGSDGSGTSQSYCFLNNGKGEFERSSLLLPAIASPSCFSIADVDNDGLPDVFIGEDDSAARGGILLINNRKNGFNDETDAKFASAFDHHDIRGCRWIDLNDDHHLDLMALTAEGDWKTFTQLTTGTFLSTDTSSITHGAHGRYYAGDLVDYNRDSLLDIVYARSVQYQKGPAVAPPPGLMKQSIQSTSYGHALSFDLLKHFAEQQASCTWADINNDGLPDCITLTARLCHPIAIFLQQEDGSFADSTFQAGLSGFSAGPDAVWVDYDNDGKTDLCTISDGHLRLFKNEISRVGNYMQLDLPETVPQGTMLEAFFNGKSIRQYVVSGRGQLMQAPPRVQFGLGEQRTVDSLVLTYPDARHELLPSSAIVVNGITPLRERDRSGDRTTNPATMTAFPNPFSNRLQIDLTLDKAANVRVAVASANGDEVAVLFEGKRLAGTSTFEWKPSSPNGQPASQGVYIYIADVDGIRYTGKASLVR